MTLFASAGKVIAPQPEKPSATATYAGVVFRLDVTSFGGGGYTLVKITDIVAK